MKIKDNIALEFNDFSKNYTKDMIACVPHYLELLSSFVKCLPKNFSPKTILDLGCGNGNVSALLMQQFPKAHYTLIDASTEMINLCRKQFSAFDILYVNKYFKDFSFKNETYDLVVAGFSLHHCDEEEKQNIFNDIYMSLKKSGLFAYSDLMISKTNPDHKNLIKNWEKFVNKSFPDGEKWTWIMEHYDAFDKPMDYQLQMEYLRSAGFDDVQTPFQKGYWTHIQAIK